jgi:4-hydroxy-3-methylbut-2-en-1-yl diphosphate synthase IspG/GcpE
MVGDVPVGGNAPVSVQSMTTTRTSDIDATLQQVAELTAAGCHIVRVAVPSQDDADALPAIAAKSQIPVIADIHFQPRYVFAAIDAGCARGPRQPRQHQEIRRQDRADRCCRHQRWRADSHRRQRRLPRSPTTGQTRPRHS